MEFQTLKKNHLKRNILIGVLVVGIISAVVLNFTRAKYRTTQSIPLVNGTINYSLPDLNIIGLYIDGVETEELDSSKNYTLNTEQSTCTYKDGSIIDNLSISYDSETGGLSISPYTTEGTRCTLYFEEVKSIPAIDLIESLYPDNQDMLAYDEYNNLRYIGANPNNYVLFNDELWRIVGAFSEDTHGVSGQKLIKLIRSESLGSIAWDSANTNNWSTASLQTTLNGDYLNCTGSYTSTGIKNAARNMIETVTWKLGSNDYDHNSLVNNWYTYERGTDVYSSNPTTWSGKVALIYPSDYGYATSGGTTTNRNTCLSAILRNWSSYSDCYNYNWLYGENQWTITHRSRYTIYVGIRGGVFYNSVDSLYSVRPSIYLKSTIVISGGTGSSSDPYIVN